MNSPAELDSKILDLLAEIVRRYMPSELEVFNLKRTRKRLSPYLLAGSSDMEIARNLTADFGPSEKILLESIPLVLGTMKAVAELLRSIRDGRRHQPELKVDEIGQKWRDALVNEGLSEERASELTSSFKSDLAVLLK
jgi:hypothetical protein